MRLLRFGIGRFSPLALGGAFLVACTYQYEPPKRPGSVPAEAVWAGGADGGAWILCKEDRSKNLCSIYNESSGDLWVRGYFVLEGKTQGVPNTELRYDFFDGERIGLYDGRVLVRDK
jgi:hypothetical protein